MNHIHTILAALRCYQSTVGNHRDIDDIATDSGRLPLPTEDEIGDLCERLNCGQEKLPEIPPFTDTELNELMEIASVALRDLGMRGRLSDVLDLCEEYLARLQERLRNYLDHAEPATPRAAIGLMEPFVFRAPTWSNSGVSPTSAEEALQRARDLASSYYALGAQCGIHSMIEWCGVMTEYVKMLGEAYKAGVDPREVDQHHADCAVSVPKSMLEYFTEKLGCQLKPFIRADRTAWRMLLEGWFEGAGQRIVCEVICQRPSVSVHPTAEAALEHAVQCAIENTYGPILTGAEDRATAEASLRETLQQHDCIREGDYEVYLLNPTNANA